MLWLALYFPQLLIDGLFDNSGNAKAIVIVHHEGSRRLVQQCNSTAGESGIIPNMPLNTAYMLQPDLQALEYDESQQRRILENLGQWALQYSSSVCPEERQVLLLEVGASLKLYGNLKVLKKKLCLDLQAQGFHFQTGVAPTPAAAVLLARAGSNQIIWQACHIRASISDIPIEFLKLDASALDALSQSGIRRCGQIFELPVSSLNRRMGKNTGSYLCKLLGQVPDPKALLPARESFSQVLDLPLETDLIDVLQFTLNRLITALYGFLRGRDLGVNTLLIRLDHYQQPSTSVRVHFAEPVQSQQHMLRICRERLRQTPLPAPIIKIGLRAVHMAQMHYLTADLLSKYGPGEGSFHQLLDTLYTRLDKKDIYTLSTCDEHLPERAWQTGPARSGDDNAHWPLRPLWLLKKPNPAPELHILSGAERIENGWISGQDIRRDYFIARDAKNSALYWVFRAIGRGDEKDKFFIHGIFA